MGRFGFGGARLQIGQVKSGGIVAGQHLGVDIVQRRAQGLNHSFLVAAILDKRLVGYFLVGEDVRVFLVGAVGI